MYRLSYELCTRFFAFFGFLVILYFLVASCELFTHINRGCFTDTGTAMHTGFVLYCFLGDNAFLVASSELFTHIHQGCFTDTAAVTVSQLCLSARHSCLPPGRVRPNIEQPTSSRTVCVLYSRLVQSNRPVSQIPQCICAVSHNAPYCKRNVHMCAHFCYKMVHCGIFVWCIVGLWDGSI